MADSGGVIPHEAEFLLFRTENGRARVEVRFDEETAWLTQAAMAALFRTTPRTITRHVAAIYAEGELEVGATCTSYVQVQTEGARRVRRHVRHYSLPMILAVGYRVRSTRGAGRGRQPSLYNPDYRPVDQHRLQVARGSRPGVRRVPVPRPGRPSREPDRV